jgi:uncharacterized membrane protein YvlD (DUF360 family)
MSSERPTPSALPVEPARPRWRPIRILVVGLAQAAVLTLLAGVLSGLDVADFRAAFVGIVVLALLNSLVWPIALRLTAPLVLVTVGLFTFVLNAALVWLMSVLIDGLEVTSFFVAIVVSFAMAVVNVAVGGLMNVDDDHVWREHAVRRLIRRTEAVESTDVPGFVFVQIDGLGREVLEEAMVSGRAPMLARLVERGTHRLVGYECDLSSQTGAMQAGILLGNNDDMPAFRWYEKSTAEVMVSNRPADAARIEARQSSGSGLLADGGASRANVFSGDAPDSLFTFSTVLDKRRAERRFLYAVATPYALLRIVILMLVDAFRERRAYRRARRDGVVPIMDRGGIYPILRAGTTVGLEEITFGVLLADVQRGAPAAYVDLVGYDEVAHHSGIAAPDALDTLERIDRHLERLLVTLADAPRPYFVVPMSDHGQTQGSTFEQRFGESLGDLTRRLAASAAVVVPELASEGWNNVNGLLTDAANDDSVVGKLVERSARGHTEQGEVAFGPRTARSIGADVSDIVVLASGNLGLLSFPAIEGRATRQELELRYPGLVEGLSTHEGIGFVLVRDEVDGDVVLGPRGVHHLVDGRVDGDDPLAVFGPRAADHLRRTSSFRNCPDLLVNSFYDPETGEGAAFEELIGFHGGLGGRQTQPFILAPRELPVPDEPLVGAVAIHHLLKSWIAAVHDPTPSTA